MAKLLLRGLWRDRGMQRRKVYVVRACVRACVLFCFWIVSYCWVGVPARLAIKGGLTAVCKTVEKEPFAGAETVPAEVEDSPGPTVRERGASAIRIAGGTQGAVWFQKGPVLANAGGRVRSSKMAGEII